MTRDSDRPTSRASLGRICSFYRARCPGHSRGTRRNDPRPSGKRANATSSANFDLIRTINHLSHIEGRDTALIRIVARSGLNSFDPAPRKGVVLHGKTGPSPVRAGVMPARGGMRRRRQSGTGERGRAEGDPPERNILAPAAGRREDSRDRVRRSLVERGLPDRSERVHFAPPGGNTEGSRLDSARTRARIGKEISHPIPEKSKSYDYDCRIQAVLHHGGDRKAGGVCLYERLEHPQRDRDRGRNDLPCK